MAERILVINDTEDILEAFRLLLEDEGYDVLLYSYAPHDLNEVRQVNPDLIILDLVFGQEKYGFKLLDALKMHRDLTTIPVIVCTAALDAIRQMEGYLTAHGVQVVLKPFDIDIFLRTVKQAIATRNNPASSAAAQSPSDDERHKSGRADGRKSACE
ncbi:MAG TPA: response regulator [Ktedonobacterales bacterium]